VISDISVTRPVFASVISLLLLVFGIIAFERLPLREYPDIDAPVVSITTIYPGASANVVETRITEIIEDRIAGIEGIDFIESGSEDGRSSITIEFSINRDPDSAANDVRDRISSILADLPDEADPPEIQKVNSNEDVIIWLNLTSERLTVAELTDYAERFLVDRFSVLEGAARVRIGGAQTYAMRIWLNRKALAARNLTPQDVEAALERDNIELPAGSIESTERQFTARVERVFSKPEDFKNLVIRRAENGYLIRLGDVARVERGTTEDRTMFRGNGKAMIGIGVIKQSTANTIDVARSTKQEMELINKTLPGDMKMVVGYDTSVFIEGAIDSVFRTFLDATVLVVIVMYLFLGSIRATIIPALAVPVSIIATFIILLMLGFSVNMLTLLALVLAIGLVVDDAIVVVENVHRRIESLQEPPLTAAYLGTRQVAFAVIATTLVIIAVFVPISFLEGDIGRLFSEFALTMAAAVAFSGFVALTLTPMLASKLLKPRTGNPNLVIRNMNKLVEGMGRSYARLLDNCLKKPLTVIIAFLVIVISCVGLFRIIPSEYAPPEDRGAFFVIVNAPEGSSYSYTEEYMLEIERRLLPFYESGEIKRLLVRAPRTFDYFANFNTGLVINVLGDWDARRSAWEIMADVRIALADLPGVQAIPVMRQGFGSAIQKPVQFVIGGGTYSELAAWRDIMLEKINQNNPGLEGIDWSYKETKPQLQVLIDYDRAADMGVSINSIGKTLETMMGSRRTTTYIDQGEEYDVIVEGERSTQRSLNSMKNIYVRSDTTSKLIPLSNLVRLEEFADSSTLNRYNRIRSITIEANLKPGYALGDALGFMENVARDNLPESVIIDYKGQSQDYKTAGGSVYFVFLLGIMVVFLVLAAQFESFVHPFIIMFTVPLAIMGGLLGLWITGNTLNLFSQIGLIMLVGLSTKNGILIVEFANQLRDEGVEFLTALKQAAHLRMRPIIMTSITTAAGAIPLMVSFGPGSETRIVIGVTVFFGVIAATLFTLFVIPVAYSLFARNTGSPGDVKRKLLEESALTESP
jgi:multidrug efflux pump